MPESGWKVAWSESALEDLRSFAGPVARLIVQVTEATLRPDPLVETRNLKSLRPNPAADKELRIRGRYRVLFNLGKEDRLAVVVAVGEKRGTVLLVRGKEYRAHHENRPS